MGVLLFVLDFFKFCFNTFAMHYTAVFKRLACSCKDIVCLYLFLSLYPLKVQASCPGHTPQFSWLSV